MGLALHKVVVEEEPGHAGEHGRHHTELEYLRIDELRRIFGVYRPLIPYYEKRPRNPEIGGWREWLQAHRG